MRKKLKYGVHKYADGGKVELYEKPKLKYTPERVKDPIAEKVVAPPGGDQTPGAKGTYPVPKKAKRKTNTAVKKH